MSAVAITFDGSLLISGGCDGQVYIHVKLIDMNSRNCFLQVRFWDIKPDVQKLGCVLKEHKGPVTAIHLANNNEEVISASSDGTCIIWDIV